MGEILKIGGKEISLGTKQVVPLGVTRDLDGSEVTVWVNVIRGAKMGPTLGLLSVQHGDEWITFELLRKTVEQADPALLAGTLLVVPVCNPIGLCAKQRNIQPKSDGPDLNRAWPGTNTWLAESIVKVLDHEVVRKCDTLLDFHHGPWGTVFGEVMYGADFTDQDLVKRCRDLGIAFGYPRLKGGPVVSSFPGPKSSLGYAGEKLGIPGVGVEIGGAGFSAELEQQWTEDAYRGIKNIMRYLGILDEPLEKPDRILTYTRTIRVDPSMGGMLVPERNPDELHREVKKGELLGKIISPYTYEELERLESPCDGWIKWWSRPYPVRPGEWGFGVVDADGAEWITP